MLMKAIVAGLIGGVVGAAVWAFISSTTGYEIGWIAWGIGGLVGFCVRVGGGDDLNFATGVAAALIAIASVAGGKYADVYVFMSKGGSTEENTEENYVSYLADDVAAQYIEEGKPVTWPAGSGHYEGWVQADFPADVWADAEKIWDGMSQSEKVQFQAGVRSDVQSNAFAAANAAFVYTFTPWDFLWFGLATFIAFKMASGEEETYP